MTVRSALVLALALAGCSHDVYEIELTPGDQGLTRRLTCWRATPGLDDESTGIAPLPAGELRRLAELYGGRETPDGAVQHVFVGRFADATPADLGGAGTYAHYGSPLGSTSAYVERFRGDDDLEAGLAHRRRLMSGLVSHVLGWLTLELGREEGFERLEDFVDLSP